MILLTSGFIHNYAEQDAVSVFFKINWSWNFLILGKKRSLAFSQKPLS